jgi:hypothetical protein
MNQSNGLTNISNIPNFTARVTSLATTDLLYILGREENTSCRKLVGAVKFTSAAHAYYLPSAYQTSFKPHIPRI